MIMKNWIRHIFKRLSDRFSISFYSDWDSFSFAPMNWRDFTFIFLRVETNSYSNILEIEFSLLGLNLRFNIWRDTEEERKKETDEFFKNNRRWQW